MNHVHVNLGLKVNFGLKKKKEARCWLDENVSRVCSADMLAFPTKISVDIWHILLFSAVLWGKPAKLN